LGIFWHKVISRNSHGFGTSLLNRHCKGHRVWKIHKKTSGKIEFGATPGKQSRASLETQEAG
jgi:hypothetical protein